MFFSTLIKSSAFSFGKASYDGLKAKSVLLDYGLSFMEKKVTDIGKPVIEYGNKLVEKYPKQGINDKITDKNI